MATRTEKIQVDVDVNGERALKALAATFTKLGAAAKSAGKIGATVAAVSSLAGPAVSGLVAAGKGIAAIGKGLATLPPLLATLPALAGGLALVIGTAKMAGPAMGKALSPIGDAFKSIQGRVGQLASEGLPKLAREFVRVNFPAIRKSMFEIAKELNFVVRETGAWVNSKSGQQAISQITQTTARAMRELSEPLANVVSSFGEMVKRVGGVGIDGAAKAMHRLASATASWMDSITAGSVATAMQSLAGWGGKIKDTFIALRDVGRWMAENEDKVKAFSDTVATAGIVVGAATGNWVAVLAGAASLAINHWDELKKAAGDFGPKVKDAFDAIKNDPGMRGIGESAQTAWKGFVDSLEKGTRDIGPKVKKMFEEWKKAWDAWAPLIKAWWEGIGKPVFSGLGQVVAVSIQSFVQFMDVAGQAMQFLGGAVRGLWDVFSQVFGFIINGAAKAFGWMPILGDNLKRAADDFNKFRDRVNAALDGIEDEVVNITYRQVGRAVPVASEFQSGIGGRASGGPVGAGRTYMVGERGPELVTFGHNGYVHNASDTQRMLGGSGSGSVSMTFGGDTQSWLAQAVMNAVRTGQLALRVNGQRVTL